MIGLLSYYAIAIVTSLIVMELYSIIRAFVSLKLGDKSGEVKNRFTIDPREHLDPIGFIMMIFTSLGFVKPMKNNVMNFSNRKRDLVLVTVLPGLILTLLMITLFVITSILNFGQFFTLLLAVKSISLWIYNLIPVYPLDGEKLITALGSPNLKMKVSQYSNILTILLIMLTLMGVAGSVVNFISNMLISIVSIFL